jgi:hypothetical protein
MDAHYAVASFASLKLTVRRENCIGPQYHKIKRLMTMAVTYNFEWDIKKAQANQDKHGVSFNEQWDSHVNMLFLFCLVNTSRTTSP